MPVTTATAADLPAVKALIRGASRSQIGLGDEDLAILVEAGSVLLVTAADAVRPLQRDQIEALVAYYPEPRPASLPAAEPDRVFLRAAAFRNGVSPSSALHQLLDAWCAGMAQRARLLIAYGGEPWYNRSLLAAGCVLAEEVIFFELPHLDRSSPALQPPPSAAVLRAATIADIGNLALLDAACFNVLWHMGPADLRQLVLFGQLTLAEMAGSLAGYLALTTRGDVAQVARLAVHPAWSGHGIGRQLLAGGLRAAADQGCRRAMLNTQADNQRAQTLYLSLGFHPTGERFEVYTRLATAA
jgi:ribosomal protein S18 acetylase RimI-like enzyme